MWSLSKKINNCILQNKLTKKYAYHNPFCVDHAHIYIYIYIFKNVNVRLNYWGWTRGTY